MLARRKRQVQKLIGRAGLGNLVELARIES